jgi:hypothetical protein
MPTNYVGAVINKDDMKLLHEIFVSVRTKMSEGFQCQKLSHYCKNRGPWFAHYENSQILYFCDICWTFYFNKNKDKITLSGQGGISQSLQFGRDFKE